MIKWEFVGETDQTKWCQPSYHEYSMLDTDMGKVLMCRKCGRLILVTKEEWFDPIAKKA